MGGGAKELGLDDKRFIVGVIMQTAVCPLCLGLVGINPKARVIERARQQKLGLAER